MPKAQLFLTCLGDQFYTSTLQNMTRILERLGVDVIFPPEQTCCGQPLHNNGFIEKTRPVAWTFLDAFGKSDAPILAPSGSCVSMVKHHYSSLFPPGTPEHRLAAEISSRIFEFTEYLVHVLKVTDVGAVYPHKVTYNATCHYLRELGFKKEAKILLNEVFFLESLKDYVRIITVNGPLLVRQSLSSLEEMLPEQEFVRIHRSFIVARRHIRAYTHETMEVGNTELPIGRLYRNEVLKLL